MCVVGSAHDARWDDLILFRILCVFGEHILSVASGQISLDTCMDYAVHKYIYIYIFGIHKCVYIYIHIYMCSRCLCLRIGANLVSPVCFCVVIFVASPDQIHLLRKQGCYLKPYPTVFLTVRRVQGFWRISGTDPDWTLSFLEWNHPRIHLWLFRKKKKMHRDSNQMGKASGNPNEMCFLFKWMGKSNRYKLNAINAWSFFHCNLCFGDRAELEIVERWWNMQKQVVQMQTKQKTYILFEGTESFWSFAMPGWQHNQFLNQAAELPLNADSLGWISFYASRWCSEDAEFSAIFGSR